MRTIPDSDLTPPAAPAEDGVLVVRHEGQPTALPWRAHQHAKAFWRIRGSVGPYFAEVDTEPDARLIERAVNNHEALLAALDGASRAYHDAAAHSGSWDTCKRFGCQGDRKLIAVAREVTP